MLCRVLTQPATSWRPAKYGLSPAQPGIEALRVACFLNLFSLCSLQGHDSNLYGSLILMCWQGLRRKCVGLTPPTPPAHTAPYCLLPDSYLNRGGTVVKIRVVQLECAPGGLTTRRGLALASVHPTNCWLPVTGHQVYVLPLHISR